MKNSRPNILFLMCDQIQKKVLDDDHPCITPHLSRLAARGVAFDRAYTPNAICSPARASLMTGLLPHNHGMLSVHHTVDKDQGLLRTDKKHWAMCLAENGYHNAYFGKWHVENTESPGNFGWHLDCNKKSMPFLARAFEAAGDTKETFALCRRYTTPGYNDTVFYAVTDVPPEKRAVGVTTAMAAEYLEEAVKKPDPWCCVVSVEEPHDPFICSEDAYVLYGPQTLTLPPNGADSLADKPGIYRKAARIWQEFTDKEKKEAMACYYASITEIDAQFGKLLRLVEESACADNTIIIFTTDHGELLGAHGMYCKNFGAFEEIYNVPLIMAGPGIDRGIRTDARVGLQDLCPTILELTGSAPITAPDSASFAQVLNGDADASAYQTGYAEYYGGRMIVTQRVVWDGRWKLVFNGFDFDELYDLEEDPLEMTNLAESPAHRDVLKRMTALLWDRVKQTGDKTLLNSHYPILRVAPYGPNAE